MASNGKTAKRQRQTNGEDTPGARQGVGTFAVLLTDGGSKKIQVIKLVRNHSGLDLGPAKSAVDDPPSIIKRDLTREEAERIVAEFTEWGARVEVVASDFSFEEEERRQAETGTVEERKWWREGTPRMGYWHLAAHCSATDEEVVLSHYPDPVTPAEDRWVLDIRPNNGVDDSVTFDHLNQIRAVHILLGRVLRLAERMVPEDAPGVVEVAHAHTD